MRCNIPNGSQHACYEGRYGLSHVRISLAGVLRANWITYSHLALRRRMDAAHACRVHYKFPKHCRGLGTPIASRDTYVYVIILAEASWCVRKTTR